MIGHRSRHGTRVYVCARVLCLRVKYPIMRLLCDPMAGGSYSLVLRHSIQCEKRNTACAWNESGDSTVRTYIHILAEAPYSRTLQRLGRCGLRHANRTYSNDWWISARLNERKNFDRFCVYWFELIFKCVNRSFSRPSPIGSTTQKCSHKSPSGWYTYDAEFESVGEYACRTLNSSE